MYNKLNQHSNNNTTLKFYRDCGVSMSHCVVGWWGEDAEQAGDPASDAREHSLTLLQGSVLQLSRRIYTRSQQPALH